MSRRPSWLASWVVMFDRIFFERYFLDQVRQFAKQRQASTPLVEFLLDDGTRLFVTSVSQTTESWLAITGHSENGEERFILCPYFSIRRITFSAPSKSAKSTPPGFKLPDGA